MKSRIYIQEIRNNNFIPESIKDELKTKKDKKDHQKQKQDKSECFHRPVGRSGNLTSSGDLMGFLNEGAGIVLLTPRQKVVVNDGVG